MAKKNLVVLTGAGITAESKPPKSSPAGGGVLV